MTSETFEQAHARLLATNDPSRFRREPCPAYDLATVPTTGRRLYTWAHGVEYSRPGVAGDFERLVKQEALRRGFGPRFVRYSPEQVDALYRWAMGQLEAIDRREAELTAVHGPIRRVEPKRARGA